MNDFIDRIKLPTADLTGSVSLEEVLASSHLLSLHYAIDVHPALAAAALSQESIPGTRYYYLEPQIKPVYIFPIGKAAE